ncbi:MAG: tRNA adenosine(34) deaminase TadA [Clostridia bacterium]|nr:tRNA adenosine(34) deaminase TadA [Clostridia bacterium]MDE7328431.1 tRNA adenosine(34) deaminase TadA [Clostridia bacterium]
MQDKEKYMRMALKQARKAASEDEVPVGAVIVRNGEVVAKAFNRKEKKTCSNFHAEIVAIEKACKKIGDWRLNECDIFVTLEPCAMCAGALINARIGNIYFGAYDSKAGCCGTLYDLPADKRFNHRPKIIEGGILQEQCAGALSEYFQNKRKSKKTLDE